MFEFIFFLTSVYYIYILFIADMDEFTVEITKDEAIRRYRIIGLGETSHYIIVFGEIKSSIFFDNKQNKWKYLKGSPRLPDKANDLGNAILVTKNKLYD